jgi:phosphopantothenoylcysteine decarboxylase / phosphopantothenate---cysteine ligase
MHILQNKNIVLGVTGGIAAYKSAELIRLLREKQANIRVAMTEEAKAFISPLTLQTLSGQRVHTDLFDPETETAMSHITLARWADVILIAPATANIIAKLAHGIADDLLSTLCLATTAPIILAPAMNQQMWHHPATQRNREILLQEEKYFLGPDEGKQACGEFGLGRMMQPEQLIVELDHLLVTHSTHAPLSRRCAASFPAKEINQSLQDIKVLITAGPTIEPIDPVRYISNPSSGKMGYALAQAAQELGANTTLISGPTHLAPPDKIKTIFVQTAKGMYREVMNQIHGCDIFIAAAAVTDYYCQNIATQKLKKTGDSLQLTLTPTQDILLDVSRLNTIPFIVGFAAETEDLLKNAKIKLQDKQLQMIIANQVGSSEYGFNSDYNAVTVITPQQQIALPRQKKLQLARCLIEIIVKEYAAK